MGLHTWFHKSAEMYDEYKKLFKISDKICDKYALAPESQKDELYNKMDYYETKLDALWKMNDCEFHDTFRTSKRLKYNEYPYHEFRSKEECLKYIEENREHIYFCNLKELDEFWEKYPKGIVRIG